MQAKIYAPILMFIILILQCYYTFSGEQTEYQIPNRLSCYWFLELNLDDKVPDEKMIWDFYERLTSSGLENEHFYVLAQLLASHGLIARQGQLADASFVEVPRQRKTRIY